MMCILNGFAIVRSLDVHQNYKKLYLLPGISAVVMGGVAFGVYELFEFLIRFILKNDYFVNLAAVLFAIFAAVLVYAVMMVKTKAVTENELVSFPKGTSMIRLLKKVHIM
jgi:stage V sporulation protein B